VHVFGVHGGLPHTLALPPPPHVSLLLHVPHWMTPPQPSPIGPQFAFSLAHVFFTHEPLPASGFVDGGMNVPTGGGAPASSIPALGSTNSLESPEPHAQAMAATTTTTMAERTADRVDRMDMPPE
jgi:hypothetical protein